MRRLLVPLVLIAVLAAACGDDTDDTAPTTTTTSTTTSSTTSTTTTSTTTTSTTTTTTTLPAIEIPVPEASTVADVLALDRPVVIGHAGGDQSWPHSTMFAFREAALAGTEVLEMDVQLTADGVLVVQHDATVDRTTETTGRVRDLTYDELQALDNGYWWSDEWSSHDLPDEAYIYRGIRTGEVEPPPGYTADDFRVETFEAIATAFPDHVLDVEIKIPAGDDGEDDLAFAIEGAQVLADEIAALGRTDSVIAVSFSDEVMAAFHGFAPEVTTSPGTDQMTAWGLGAGELLPTDLILQVPPFFGDLEVLEVPGLLDKAEAEGLAVWVWPSSASTQENADYYASLVTTYGIDGIIAGHPELAVERYRAEGFIP
ncbi:MAG: glycerophosphoryl diester phosphodiesterase [Acidimicrobiales bacterium]|nr:MAG: glycerophosphoryl diester phosphodiesterase [Acidimicrobiales bacterium]